MKLSTHDLFGLLVATSFAAGLNVYATVATLGLLSRAGAIALPPSLQLLASWYVIAAAVILFAIEFFADKIPAFDLIWNALHTFIRVPIAALLAWRATAQLSPGEQLLAAIAGGVIALVAHGGKTAARAAVTPSPEPLSNTALSAGEDVIAIGLTWFATRHPWIAGTIALAAVVVLVAMIRWIIRAMSALFHSAEDRLTGKANP
ncbi:MAG TPA: DUF4126 domain-containing protein [Terriglobales bacterium]